MAVAPSFQKYPLYGEPYEKNGRQYIKIVYPDGHHREVRWHEKEPPKSKSNEAAILNRLRTHNLKKALGFTNGYITIFKGDIDSLIDWFHEEPKCRYHCSFGWYIVSTDELPQIPAGLEPIQLKWEDVAFADEEQLRPESEIREYIDSLVYDPSPSRWQGEVGDRLEKALTVTKVIPIEGYYGNSTMHIFSDSEENVYIWTTAAKTLEIGKTYIIRGTVKEHKMFKNVPQTILTRCAICQDKAV